MAEKKTVVAIKAPGPIVAIEAPKAIIIPAINKTSVRESTRPVESWMNAPPVHTCEGRTKTVTSKPSPPKSVTAKTSSAK
jgi:hypothetical protein